MVNEQNFLMIVVVIVLSYLIGSLPTAYLIAKTRRINIFDIGSGNMGGTNIARAMGVGWGVMTIVLDAVKGVVAVFLARALLPNNIGVATTISSIVVVVGHNWSLFASLIYTSATKSKYLIIRGGKGGATAFGTLITFAPATLVIGMFAFGFVLFLRTRYVSLGVLSAFMIAIPWVVVLVAQEFLPAVYIVYSIAIAFLIVIRFRENIERIVNGTERRLGEPTA
jgi:acyl phosphate:glycerol-3-phosphate acyltransferase